MKNQLQAIREALERAQNGLKWYRDAHPGDDSGADDEMDAEIEEALTALSELEAMVGEPVAWVHPTLGHMQRRTETMSPEVVASYERCGWTPLYTAAPVAQQYEAGDMASAHNDGFRAGVASVAQQPQAEPTCNPHPKAPHGFNRNASHTAGRYVCDCEGWDAWDAGYSAGWQAGFDADAPQQAEAVPSDVVPKGGA